MSLVESAGDVSFSENEKRNLFEIQTDENGIVDFNIDIEPDLLAKLEECIRKSNIRIKSSCLNKFVMDLKAKELWLYICSETSERVIKELEEDYGETEEQIRESIISEVQLFIASYIRKKVSEPYKNSVQMYVNYLDSVKEQFKSLLILFEKVKIEDSMEKKAVSSKYESRFVQFLSAIFETLDEFLDENSVYNLEIRVEDLSKKIHQLEQLLNSYLSLFVESASCLIDKYAFDKTEKIWPTIVKRANSLSFDSDIYLYLIELVKKWFGKMPGTLFVVLSEINAFASRNNINLDDNNMFDGSSSEFQVSSSSDKDEAGRSLTYVNNYGGRIYFE